MIYYVLTNNDIACTRTNTLTVGSDGTGYDVKFFGDTSGCYFLWDQSEDYLQLTDSTDLVFGTDKDVYMGVRSSGANRWGKSFIDTDAQDTHGLPIGVTNGTSDIYGTRLSFKWGTGEAGGTYAKRTLGVFTRLEIDQDLSSSGDSRCFQAEVKTAAKDVGGELTAGYFDCEAQGACTVGEGVTATETYPVMAGLDVRLRTTSGAVNLINTTNSQGYAACIHLYPYLRTNLDGNLSGLHIGSVYEEGGTNVQGTAYGILFIDDDASVHDWDYGIYISDSTCVTGIQIGDCTTGITLDGTITTGLNIAAGCSTAIDTSTCAIILDAQPAVASTGKAIYIAATVASPGLSDGHVAYFDVTYSGTVSGLTRNVGIWTNLATGAVWSGYAHFVLDVGFYHGSNDFAGDLYLLNLDFECNSTSTPGTVAMIRTNCDTAEPPDYFIVFENDESGAIVRSDPGTTFFAYIKVKGNEDNKTYAIPLVDIS